MPTARPKSLLPLLLSILLLPVVCSSYAQQPKSRKHVVKPQAAPAPQPAPPPPVPLTPEQLPATLPQVSYRDNQLTIVAQNSTLSDILRAVRTQTGAVVEIPANANERVVAHLGPGPARDVLAALLNGSHFDYVMLGSATNPSAVERVILTSKTGPAPSATPVYQAAIQQVAAPPDPSPSVEQPQDAEDGNDDEFANDTELEDEQAADAPAPTQGPVLPNGQPASRTPEQLLQELQRQQQQLQQQGQGGQPVPQPPGGPTPPGQQPPPQQ